MPDDRSAIRSLLPVRPPLFVFRSTHRNHFRDCRTVGCGQDCLAWDLSPGVSHIDAQSSRESVLHGRALAFRDHASPQGLSAILDQQREAQSDRKLPDDGRNSPVTSVGWMFIRRMERYASVKKFSVRN